MLQKLRDKTSGWIATVILGLLIIPFAFFGMESYMSQRMDTYVARIALLGELQKIERPSVIPLADRAAGLTVEAVDRRGRGPKAGQVGLGRPDIELGRLFGDPRPDPRRGGAAGKADGHRGQR